MIYVCQTQITFATQEEQGSKTRNIAKWKSQAKEYEFSIFMDNWIAHAMQKIQSKIKQVSAHEFYLWTFQKLLRRKWMEWNYSVNIM